MNHQIKHKKTLTTFWQNAFIITAAIAIAAAVILLAGCQKESSFTRQEKPVIESKCNLMPREGFTPQAKRDHVPEEVAGGKGKGRGKPKPQPPTDTTGNDNPDNPPATYQATLYLAMDGENLSSTWWYGLPSYVAPSGLTQSERDTVVNRTTLEYAGYGYKVTTDRGYYMLANPLKRQMTVFTESWEWYGQAGGVAYLNSFGMDQPCFVFTSLLNYNEKYIADAGIHEIGHTVGLHHIPQPDGSSQYATYGNYMGAAYYVHRGIFEEGVKDITGATVYQKTIIRNKAQ